MPTVIPPAIAAISDVYGWLLRGFVESGLTDGTGRNVSVSEAGVLDASNILQLARGAEGLRLSFLCPAGKDPDPEDEFVYLVKQAQLTNQPDRSVVVARCPESLFYQEFDEAPYETLATRVLSVILAHNARFTSWRQRGGSPSMAERRSVPDARGLPASAPLANFLERHYKAGNSLADGPAAGWWNERYSARELGKQISAGQGGERFVLHRPPTEAEKPENIAYIKQLRFASLGMIATGGAGFVWIAGILGFAIYRWVTISFGAILTMGWPLASLVLTGVIACAQIWAGWQLRNLRSAFLVQGIALLGMLPCGINLCCLMGLPAGALVMYRMRDERMERVFES